MRSAVQSRSTAPRRNKRKIACSFFIQKRTRLKRCSSFFAKGHVQVGYSLVNALITPSFHYQPFVIACLRHGSIGIYKRRCSSFFAKRHARLICSFVNALTTARCHYHLFTTMCLRHRCIYIALSRQYEMTVFDKSIVIFVFM